MRPRDKFEFLFSNLSEASTVAPSKIGGQFYCEKKVHLEQELGEVETPEKQRGSERRKTPHKPTTLSVTVIPKSHRSTRARYVT